MAVKFLRRVDDTTVEEEEDRFYWQRCLICEKTMQDGHPHEGDECPMLRHAEPTTKPGRGA